MNKRLMRCRDLPQAENKREAFKSIELSMITSPMSRPVRTLFTKMYSLLLLLLFLACVSVCDAATTRPRRRTQLAKISWANPPHSVTDIRERG